MLTDELKGVTTAVHQQLEKRLLKRIKAINDGKGYEQLLRLFYGFYHGLEERIDKAIDLEKLPDYPSRRKSPLLFDDLAIFSSKPPFTVPVHVNLPEIDDHLEAMGALYVLEQSTLGGKVVTKMLIEKLGLKSKKGISFFLGYASETWQKWETFKKSMNTLVHNTPDAEKIERAAIETFNKFIQWIEDYEKETTV